MSQIYQNIKNKEAVHVYYAGSVLINLASALTFSIYTIFLIKNGLNLFQICLVNVAYMVTIILLEVPTGAFADAIGRKKAVLFSSIVCTIGFATYALSRTLTGFIVAEILVGVSSALAYGAFEAWLVKVSTKQNFTGKVDFVFSQANIVAKASAIIGGVAGAYFANINLASPFLVGAVLCFVQFLFFLFFMIDDNEETKRFELGSSISEMKKIVFGSAKYCVNHNVLIWILLGGAVYNFATQPLNMFWAPKFNDMLGDKIWLMGWLWAIISGASLIGAFWVRNMIKKGRSYTYITVLGALIFSVMIFISSTSIIAWLAISSFVLHEFSRGGHEPVQLAFINKFADEKKRATILSFESMISTVGSALGLLFFGYFAEHSSIAKSWFLAAVIVLVVIPLYLKARRKEQSSEMLISS